MNITYLGHSSFRIKSMEATIICDPYSFSCGLHFPKQKADIVTISHEHEDHNFRKGIKNDDCFFVDKPGEYEIKNIMISGFKTYHDKKEGEENGKNTIFVYKMEGITLCHLGDLGHEINGTNIKQLQNIDILFVPVGGVYTINPAEAKKVVKKIDPAIVIPMHYKTEGMSEVFEKLSSVEEFLEEMAIEPKKESKLQISETSIPEEMEIVILERKK